MRKQRKMEYEAPSIVINELAFEGNLCQSQVKARITVKNHEEIDEEVDPSHKLEF